MRLGWFLCLWLVSCGTPGEGRDDRSDTASPDPQDPLAWWEDVDVDADGVSAASGDCNDLDSAVFPGADDDTCDGVDNDCDGVADQDSLTVDAPVNLGIVTDVEESQILSFMFPEADDQRIRFYVEDEILGWFDIEVWAYQVPPDVDVKVTLYWVEDADGVDRGFVDEVDDVGAGGFEFLNHGGSTGSDDSGWYEAVITATEGANCGSPVQIQLAIGTL